METVVFEVNQQLRRGSRNYEEVLRDNPALEEQVRLRNEAIISEIEDKA